MSTKINQEDLTKALSALEDMAKGHNSRGTAATEVVSMDGEGGPTQVFHTPSDSDPGTWAGTSAKPSPDNGATDAISENGTDYDGGAEMVKSIMELVKAGKLSPSDAANLISKAFSFGKDDDKDKDKDDKAEKAMDKDDDKDEVKKSLVDLAKEDDEVRKGLEVSDFLSGWAEGVSKSLDGTESRIQKSIAKNEARQEAFNEGLVKALSDLGNAVAATAQRVEQVESQPASAPKSIMGQQVQVIEKSLAGGEPAGESLNKSQIDTAMEALVKSGDMDPFEVLRYDTSGDMKPEVRDAVAGFYRKS